MNNYLEKLLNSANFDDLVIAATFILTKSNHSSSEVDALAKALRIWYPQKTIIISDTTTQTETVIGEYGYLTRKLRDLSLDSNYVKRIWI